MCQKIKFKKDTKCLPRIPIFILSAEFFGEILLVILLDDLNVISFPMSSYSPGASSKIIHEISQGRLF